MSEQFVKMPNHVLRRVDITSTAKLVFAAIMDRMGTNGTAWPGLRRIASDCGISKNAARRAVDSLDEHRLLIVDRGGSTGGRPNVYSLPPEHIHGGSITTPSVHEPDPSGPKTAPSRSKPVLCRSDSGPHFGSKTGTEPDPINQTHEPNTHAHPDNRGRRAWTVDEVMRVYHAYPRKIGKRPALRAIRQALGRLSKQESPLPDPLAWLLERVRAFAQSEAGQAGKFTPYPATFFNQERYNDDPSEWTKGSGAEQRSRVCAPSGKYAGIG